MLKGQKKHIDKEQGNAKHEASHIVNYRTKKNKNSIGTTALERSVVYITGAIKPFHCTNFVLFSGVFHEHKVIRSEWRTFNSSVHHHRK